MGIDHVPLLHGALERYRLVDIKLLGERMMRQRSRYGRKQDEAGYDNGKLSHLWFLLFSRLRGFRSLGRLLLFLAIGIQRVRDAIVAFVACMLKDGTVDFHKRHLALPRLHPCLGIVDNELIAEGILVDPREAFSDLQLIAGPLEGTC